jgi:phosphatidylserine/phosphatidylglycerophosphate/cardiolipin synthase-like enzyme
VLIAGYSFERGEGSWRRCTRRCATGGWGWRCSCTSTGEETPDGPEWYLRTQAAAWRSRYWPFGAPTPTLYVDPRAAVPRSYASLHAKCIVVDGERALVGSANFTDRGHARNIEAGVLVEDARFATELARQFHDAVGAGLFVEGSRRVCGCRGSPQGGMAFVGIGARS